MIVRKIVNFLKYRTRNLGIRLRTLFYKIKKTKRRRIFLLGVAEHGNFGDFAISQAEYEFLTENFGEKIYEFSEEDMSNPLTYELIAAMLSPGDLIFCQGGGNHGNVYGFCERYRREVIKHFTDNRIIIFPQTYYFTDDADGEREAEISKNIYNAHPDLIIAMRDELSFKLAREAYHSAKVVFCPDMVLYLMNSFKKEQTDESVMLILRKGIEEKISQKSKEIMIEELKKDYTVKFNDHTASVPVNKHNRLTLIERQIMLYSKSRVVVTDKLHGAIFAILTGTPCVMLSTFNHKIKEVSKLFTGFDGYYFCEDIESALACVKKAYGVRQCNNPDLKHYYNDFLLTINE